MLEINKIITKCSKEELMARFLLGDYCPVQRNYDLCTIFLLKISNKSAYQCSVFVDPKNEYFIRMLDKKGIFQLESYNIYEYYTDFIYAFPISITLEDFKCLYNKLS